MLYICIVFNYSKAIVNCNNKELTNIEINSTFVYSYVSVIVVVTYTLLNIF